MTQRQKLITATILCSSLSMFATNSNGDATAKVDNLDDLLTLVKNNGVAEGRLNQTRIREFEAKRQQQAQLLQQAQAEVRVLEETGAALNRRISDNERTLGELEAQLAERSGNFGELFGVVRQVAADTRAQIDNSIISAQYPGRGKSLAFLADSKTLPSAEELRALWLVLLQEQTEQGKVARFDAEIGDEDGRPLAATVTRVGPFSAVAAGKYLNFKTDSQSLQLLGRQPPAVHQASGKSLSSARPGEIVTATIDPSRGTILGMLVNTPDLLERFEQGGVVGYAVSILAAIGFLIGLQRLLSLVLVSFRVQRQLKDSKPRANNPLGRVLKTYEEHADVDLETLELKLDDAILQEIPRLERGLNVLKVFAAIAPLMGLLGTVMGMIVTFQAITLWGAGEPKFMAGGISQALVTTVLGLVAAIPLLLLHSFAQGKARRVQQILQEQSAGLIARRAEVRHV